jgi:hypothetical protein
MIRLRSLVFALTLPAAASAAVDPALLGLVMPDARIVSGIQVSQSQASAFGQHMLAQIPRDSAVFQKFVTATGFDPRRDLQEIVAASSDPSATSAANGNGALILARGTFQPDTILTVARGVGSAIVNYRGIDIITAPARSGADSLAFLDGATAVVGGQSVVKATIDRRFSGAIFSGALADKARAVSGGNDAWFATLAPLSEFVQGRLGGSIRDGKSVAALSFLQTILQTSGGISFGADAVTVSAEAMTQSAEDAQTFVNAVKFLGGMLQASPSKDARAAALAKLLASAKFEADGTLVRLTLSVPEQELEQWFPRTRTRRLAGIRQ